VTGIKQTLLILMAVALVGCATSGTSTRKLTKISLGMNKTEVFDALGEPTAVRGAMVNKFSQSVEVWEYRLNKGKTAQEKKDDAMLAVFTLGLSLPSAAGGGEEVDYWMYFHDNKLWRWGQAGDWKKEADRIMEIRINPSPNLP
jgi:hypothetical protein